MNTFGKSESIKTSLRKGFQEGNSKMAARKCYGYDTTPKGLIVNHQEAKIVRWIFARYLAGDSLGKLADGLAKQRVLSPSGRPRWNREAIDKILSNEKYTGKVLLQKTISDGVAQIKNDGLMERYLYTDTHEAIISDEQFKAVQQAKVKRSNCTKEDQFLKMTFQF